MNSRPSSEAPCTVTRAHLLALIDAIVYTLGAADYSPVEDELTQYLVTKQIDAIFALADEIGFDLWVQTAAPYCRDDTAIATLLRDVQDVFGLPRYCRVPECEDEALRCCERPSSLAPGTRWPSCPELRAHHSLVRYRILKDRVLETQPALRGPIHDALMPLPGLEHLVPSPEELVGL